MKSLRSLQVPAIWVALTLLAVASYGRSSDATPQRLVYRDSPPAEHHKGIQGVLVNAFSYRPFEHAAALADAPTATFQVTYHGSWSAAARAAFEHALNIWSTIVNSTVPIRVRAEFANLPGPTLGSAEPFGYVANFSGAPIGNTWFADAIADRLAGGDLFPADPADIEISFDSSPATPWYFGTDAHPPANTFDFVSIALHELAHGLGFTGSAFVSNGLGYWGLAAEDIPDVFWPVSYDRYTRASGAAIIDFADGSLALANALTGGNLFFSSPVVADASHPAISTAARLYAPSPWDKGGSYSHLDEATYPAGNANSLMTPLIGTAEANHNPGPITGEIFTDIGWGAVSGGVAPGQPTVTSAVASGGVLTVTWTSGGGGAPTSHQLDFYSFGTLVGSVPWDASTTANINLPPGVIGTFGVRVTASNSAGSSPPSAQVDFTIVTGGGGAPGQPTVTSAVASGGVLTVTWTSGSGATPTEHLLEFYSGPTLVAPIGVGAATSFAVQIPPGVSGTFGVRVTAFNGTVASPASNEYLFTIGPACTVPAAPIVTGGIVGGTATVNWPPVAGATSYLVSAGTAPGGTQYLPPTPVGGGPLGASGLPSGFVAWVRVAAVNACGQQGPATDFLVQ